MTTESPFWRGVKKLITLNQKALNKWVLELFKYGLDFHFSSCLIGHDGYPSVAITDIFEASQKLEAVNFEKRLRLAICNLLKSIPVEINEPALIYDLLLTIADNKITEVVNEMIKLINSGQMKKILYEEIDLHFQFLKILATLYQNGQPNTPGGKLDKRIKNALQKNLHDPKYEAVCHAGLKRIKKKS